MLVMVKHVCGKLRWQDAFSGEVPRGEKMLCSGTDAESYITEYTLVYEDKLLHPAAG